MDKNFCSGSCVLLSRLQMVQASRMEPQSSSAVDAGDEDRYRLMNIYDFSRHRLDGLSL
ncbi:MAG: hypothetical protein KQI81_05540 [Deltaproteobacteria bacterium]|nr:hypothetical protein [Deltaproteobacteria bacterium]